jgi:uracil phosphoribosyltransferase
MLPSRNPLLVLVLFLVLLFLPCFIDVTTSSKDFVHYANRMMRLVAEEALAYIPSRRLPSVLSEQQQQYNHDHDHDDYADLKTGTLRDLSTSTFDASHICAISIMRGGDGFIDMIRHIEPSLRIGKILIQRDESISTKKAPILYYHNLPSKLGTSTPPLCYYVIQ